MKCIKDILQKDLKGKKVLLRAGLNSPVENGVVADDFRIRKARKTIEFLSGNGARVIVISHIGREKEETLRPVADVLKVYIPNLIFVQEGVGEHARTVISGMNDGDVVLLENLRQSDGEVSNSEVFARELAGLAEIYVNDAFSVCHRKHASIVGVPKLLPSYSGLLLEDEIEHLSIALNPPSPSFAVIGGAKFDTKESLIKKLIDVYDRVFVGGALANNIFLAKGFEVGLSLVSDSRSSEDILLNKKVIAPPDVVAEDEFGNSRVARADGVKRDEKIVDVGPDSIQSIVPFIKNAKLILWNGPMGRYEDGFDEWTRALAREIAESDAKTIVGGGDTLGAIQKEGLEDKFTFISTGGGAMLQYLTDGTLPGVNALQ